jgi:hypothetical protein
MEALAETPTGDTTASSHTAAPRVPASATTPTAVPSASELLRAWDASRPRSQQRELGVSALGGCRRAAGYRLAGTPADEGYDTGGLQAIMGTAIHDTFAAAARVAFSDFAGHVVIENAEIQFAGLVGHPDLYVEPLLVDLKTLGYSMQLEKIRRNGPSIPHLWQVAVYAAGMILQGHPVERVRINYLCRDSGEEHVWEDNFRIEHVRDAVAWLDNVRKTEVELLPRDYRPDSAYCKNCSFFQRCWADSAIPGRDLRTVFYVEDPSAARWGARLADARARKAQAEADEADAKGALDALRTVTNAGQSEDVKVPGLAQVIRFSVGKPRASFDRDQIEADYARAGARPPVKYSEPSVRVILAASEEDT